ncbi:AI-2E family transporter YdiK [Povalibacter sp.]|uniref:AI-2E family transporter YdiK n=1 Tax=Povalibacter sp. TaxID=1962978 RepID=UPI002F3E3843
MNHAVTPDTTRTTLMVLIIGILIVGSLWTLLPFIGALVWATALVVATWPMLLWVERKAGGRRSIATMVMTLLVAVVFIVPFYFAVGALLDGSAHGVDIIRSYLKNGLGPPPAWLAGIPGVGERLTGKWSELAALSPDALAEAMRPYVRSVAAWIAAVTGGIGGLVVHILFTLILTGVLYAQGELAAAGVVAFARRLGGERGANVVVLAGQSVRSVALGVVVTALVQTALAGLGLWVSGVPHAGLLTAAIFVLCIAQLGPFPVLIPVLIWAFGHMSIGWAIALLVWSIPVGIMDNFLRPILISRGVDLPLLLIFGGVIGGLIGFGVIGLFIGPVILAVTYTLLQGWVRDNEMSVAPTPRA